jgi:hypothetical protein
MTGFYRDRLQMELNYLTGWSALSRIAGRVMAWVCNYDSHSHVYIPSNIK